MTYSLYLRACAGGREDRALRGYVTCFFASKLTKKITKHKRQKNKKATPTSNMYANLVNKKATPASNIYANLLSFKTIDQ